MSGSKHTESLQVRYLVRGETWLLMLRNGEERIVGGECIKAQTAILGPAGNVCSGQVQDVLVGNIRLRARRWCLVVKAFRLGDVLGERH